MEKAVHDYKRIAEIIMEQLGLPKGGGEEMSGAPKRYADCGLIGPAVSLDFTRNLMSYLDARIIGQDSAKKAVTGALLQYFRYGIRQPLLLIGGTGCGKTHLLNTAMTWARENVPRVHFKSVNVSRLTADGWSGLDFEDAFGEEEFQRMEKEAYYVMHWDEIDKLMKPAHNTHNEDHNALTCGQLMNALSGEDRKLATVDWSRVLVVCTGAFEWLKEERRKCKLEFGTPVGFGSVGSPVARMTDRDLLEHAGVMKELLGRFSCITHLDPLDSAAMLRILRLSADKGGYLETRRELFKKEGIRVVLDPGALELIAVRAAADRRGARSIQTVLHGVLGPEVLVDCLMIGRKTLHITGKEGVAHEHVAVP